ncbi:MAG: hypothetical protein WCA10_02890 [Terracidiphilus sp.]
MSKRELLIYLSALLLFPLMARAQWEVETDPAAYALKGFSAHVGRPIWKGKAEVLLGAYGLETPKAWHGNEGFTETSKGIALKPDYFPLKPAKGLFVGMEADFSRDHYRFDSTGEDLQRNHFRLGPRLGYRFDVGRHFYISPWCAVVYQFNSQDEVISGHRFKQSNYTFFPTVHLGWRF